MRRPSPKHLVGHDPDSPPARPRVGIFVTVAAVAVALFGLRSASSDPTAGSAATPTSVPTTISLTPATTTRPRTSGLLPDSGFEAGTSGWRPLGGARLERVPAGRTGGWAARVGSPGMTAPDVARCRPGSTYGAQVWVKADRAGQTVEIRLIEVAGRTRYAVDTVGVVLPDTGWHQVEVAHLAHRPGTRLAFELVASGPGVLVDDVDIGPQAHGS